MKMFWQSTDFIFRHWSFIFFTSLSSTQYILKSKPVNHVEIQSLLIIMAAIPNLTNENQLMGSRGLETLNNLEKSLKEHSVAGK